jgi:hypothetical protein
MKISKDLLKRIIKEESLKLMKENQAFSNIYDKIDDVDAGFIQVNQKRFDQLRSKEEQAKDKEEYSELRDIKSEQSKVLSKLIKSYEKKLELLKELKDKIDSEGDSIQNEGDKVFSNKELNEVTDETLPVGQFLVIKSPSTETRLRKYTDGNKYQIVSTNINGLESGDYFSPKSEIRVGSPCKVDISRDIAGGPEYLKTIGFKTITTLVKNPS